ncbi:MAG TPA: hypothetical protein VGR39_07640 [Candidatus Acidoferrales bacterium]|nr:hypothetical protein [Candidatus Acidoferrales bacterium]
MGFNGAYEPAFFVRAVAKRLIGGVATTAKRDHGAAVETEHPPLRIDDLEVTLDANRAVVFD